MRLTGSLARVGVLAALTVAAAAGIARAWMPAPGERWQYQLQGNVDATICAKPVSGGACVRPDVYDIDLYDDGGAALNTPAVASIHARGAHAICYVDAGTWEDWRPDAAQYPDAVKGKPNGWPGEKWLDVRQTAVLLPIVAARVQKCVDAGFDAVEFDNVDGYSNVTGFPLTADDQLAFDRALAGLAHDHGLPVGLKNDVEQAGALATNFDFAINEQCFKYRECGVYDAWIAAGRAVLEIEYSGTNKKLCADAQAHGRDAIRKKPSLKATPWTPCR